MQHIEIDGTRLVYLEAGDPAAEPVVLLHGYMGSHQSWRHLIEPLAATHRVLALDWFGWGASGRNPGLPMDYDAELDRLGRVLDGLGLEACNLFGHDYGGFLGLGFCERHPERVLRLALLNSRVHASFTPFWYGVFGLASVAMSTPGLRGLIARLPLARLHRLGIRRELRRGIFGREELEGYLDWMERDPQGSRHLVRLMGDYSVRVRPELGAGLGGIRAPVAVVWGARDRFLAPRIARELAARIPDARLTLLEDVGHFVMEEAPSPVLEALQALLQRPV